MNSPLKIIFILPNKLWSQQHDLYIGSLDVDFLFNNIPLEETIEICTNELFKESETVEGLILKSFLSLAT